MSLSQHWNYPTTIWFGANKINTIHLACAQLHLKKPLVVTDPGLSKMTCFTTLIDQLNHHHIDHSVFCDLKPNPTASNVRAGVNALKLQQCDGVIAIGGGSALDCAKSIAVIAQQDCDIIDLEDASDNYTRADSSKVLACIAIPTTAGTGSEVGRAALIIDETSRSKKIIFHPNMTPNIVIADPTLTLTVPAKLTAATGMDALAHNLEAYFAPGFHPMADGIALEAMRLINDHLIYAFQNGDNLDARSYMLAASLMGATAFQKGLGAIHSLSHPVGALYDAHHGLLNAIFMPYVLKLNREAISDKCQRLADYLQLPHGSDGFDRIYNWVIFLLNTLELPSQLSDIGIDNTHAEEIARQALQDGSSATNPIKLTHELLKTTFLQSVIGSL